MEMIKSCEIINQPDSGEYDEIIYDFDNPWNSSQWTYIKFVEMSGVESLGVCPIKLQSQKLEMRF